MGPARRLCFSRGAVFAEKSAKTLREGLFFCAGMWYDKEHGLRRGKALWSAARFVCRMTLCACRSSSRKTRHAIFVGALKNKKALAHSSPRRSCAAKDLQRNASRNLFCAAKEIRELKSNPARRVPLRCVSRGRARARTEISPQWEIPCEQMAKSPPGSLQESICSHSICLILEAYCS